MGSAGKGAGDVRGGKEGGTGEVRGGKEGGTEDEECS